MGGSSKVERFKCDGGLVQMGEGVGSFRSRGLAVVQLGRGSGWGVVQMLRGGKGAKFREGLKESFFNLRKIGLRN